MKKFLIALLLACSSTLLGQSAAPSSVHVDGNPVYWTGSSTFQTNAIYNEADNYQYAPEEQMQPSALIETDDTFNSTSDWTIQETSGSPTFTVASNQGTVTRTTNTSDKLFMYENTWSFPSNAPPQVFVQMEIDSVPSTGLVAVGVFNSSYEFFAEYNKGNSYIGVAFYDGSSYHYSHGVNIGSPSTPWKIGFMLTGNIGRVYLYTSSGWQLEDSLDATSYYSFTTPGNMSGWGPGMGFYGGAPATYVVSNFKAGYGGGDGFRDNALVTYPDGRPYIANGKIYFGATVSEVNGTNYEGVFSYDISTGDLAQTGVIYAERSSVIYGDVAYHIVYDPANSEYRVLMSSWATSSTLLQIFYAAVPDSTNLLNGGWVVDFSTGELTLPGQTSCGGAGCGTYDPYLVCNQYNYSTDACSNWPLAYDVEHNITTIPVGTPALATSASDPSANSWTLVGSSSLGAEGGRIIRVNGDSGVAYYPVWCDPGSSNKPVFFDSSMVQLGYQNAPPTNGGTTYRHPMYVPIGSNWLFATFNGHRHYNLASFSWGNFQYATFPRNPPLQMLTYVAETGSAAVSSITSPSVTIPSQENVLVVCRTGGNTAAATASSLPSATWTQLASVYSGSPETISISMATVQAGSTTFTCNMSPSIGYDSMTVMKIENTTGLDTGATWGGYGSAATSATSGTWSTSARAIGLFCVSVSANNQSFIGGSIAGNDGLFSGFSMAPNGNGDLACEYSELPAAVSSQTASLSWGSSYSWTGLFVGLKH